MRALPRYSQYLDVVDPAWQPKACGIVALRTVLAYWQGEENILSADALIQEGLALDGFISGIGWKHQTLVDIARAQGCEAQRADWSKEDSSAAFTHLQDAVARGPVIASIHTHLDPTSPDGHLIVVHGIDTAVHYYDPAQKERDAIPQEAPIADFISGWKKRVILISPQKSVHS